MVTAHIQYYNDLLLVILVLVYKGANPVDTVNLCQGACNSLIVQGLEVPL